MSFFLVIIERIIVKLIVGSIFLVKVRLLSKIGGMRVNKFVKVCVERVFSIFKLNFNLVNV